MPRRSCQRGWTAWPRDTAEGRGAERPHVGGHMAERWWHHTAATQDSAGQGLHTWAWRPCSHPQEARCGWDSAGEQWAACGLSTRSPLDPGRALGACKDRRTRMAGQTLPPLGSTWEHQQPGRDWGEAWGPKQRPQALGARWGQEPRAPGGGGQEPRAPGARGWSQ